MKQSEIINIINKIENEFPVDKWVIDKIHIWPLIRNELGSKLFYLGVNKPKDIGKLKRRIARLIHIFRNFLKYAYAYTTDFRHNDTIDSPVDIIFLTNSEYRTLLKGLYYDRLCEPFIDTFQDIDMKTLSFEYAYDIIRYKIPRSKPSVFIQSRIDYLETKNRLFKKKPNIENERLDGFYGFIKFLESKNYGIIIPNIQDLRYQVGVILGISEYFKNIFNKIKPSIAFVPNYSSSIGFAFNLACRQIGIPSVDIQHGLAGEYHSYYGRWNKIPEDGFEVLPSVFWCWGQEDANAILKWNKNVSNFHRPFVGGNLWLNLWRNQNNDTVKYYDNQIIQIKAKSNKSVFILYGFNKIYGIPEWIIDAMRTSSDFFHWWIRIHYGQLNERETVRNLLKKHNINNFDLDLATDLPLPALLRHTDLHITNCSATIIDAEYFSVPSIFTDENGIEFIEKEIASGMAVYAHTTEELQNAIRVQLGKKNKFQKLQKESHADNSKTIKRFLEDLR